VVLECSTQGDICTSLKGVGLAVSYSEGSTWLKVQESPPIFIHNTQEYSPPPPGLTSASSAMAYNDHTTNDQSARLSDLHKQDGTIPLDSRRSGGSECSAQSQYPV
jgi:hypothetical protein